MCYVISLGTFSASTQGRIPASEPVKRAGRVREKKRVGSYVGCTSPLSAVPTQATVPPDPFKRLVGLTLSFEPHGSAVDMMQIWGWFLKNISNRS